MTKTDAEKAYGLMKAYVESSNRRLRVSVCRNGDGDAQLRGAVKLRRIDGPAFRLTSYACSDTMYYRSKADFVRMLLGCETGLSKMFRARHYSVGIAPVARSVEELRLKYEVMFGGFPRNAI